MEINKKPDQAAVKPERITLRDLGKACRGSLGCLKCEMIEFCCSYERFMNSISPRWWLTAEEQYGMPVPNVELTKSAYRFRKRDE